MVEYVQWDMCNSEWIVNLNKIYENTEIKNIMKTSLNDKLNEATERQRNALMWFIIS